MAPVQHFPLLAVSSCIWRGDKVLIIQRGKPPLAGIWSLPGGHVEAGEAIRSAALRELQEETGVIAKIGPVIDAVDVIRRNDQREITAHYAIVCFLGHWISGDPQAGSDAIAACWSDQKTLEKLEFTNGTKAIIARAREMAGI